MINHDNIVTLCLLIAYDGSDFAGWQRQGQGERTVQGELETALGQVLQQSVALIGAGRTDSGVHAEGQVASARIARPDIPLDQLRRAVNSLTGEDVQVLSIEEAPSDFHARFSAVSRSYRYQLDRKMHPMRRRFAWTPQFDWDDAIIAEAVALLPGRHSFRSFCLERPGEKGYISNIIEASWSPDSDGATFHITADRFFHKMVRGLVMALWDAGRGYYSLEQFIRLLEEPMAGAEVRVAPAKGLVLEGVGY